MMRRATLVLTVLAIATVALAAAPASAARRCSVPPGARVLDRTSEAVVWTRGTFATFGCHRSAGRNRRLPNEGGGIRGEQRGSPSRPGLPTLSGRYVGYVTFGSAIGDEFDRMYVYDLIRGRVKSIGSSNFVRTFVLKRNGSVAWVQSSIVQPADPNQDVYEVRKIAHDERQGNVLVDRGAGIDPASLALSSDRRSITWTNGGAQRTASLG
jgi:hypothetical protein